MLLRLAVRRVSAARSISLRGTVSHLEVRGRAAAHVQVHSTPTHLNEITRSFSNVQNQSNIVNLDYAAQIPPNVNPKEGALVILHGLFGSKRNFASLAKQFMKDLNIPVYSLDLRNQGSSPHLEPMTYSAMAKDVIHFLNYHSLSKVTLLGHSMGGKVAMSVALHPYLSESKNAQILSKLIVVDVAPIRAELSPEFKGYVEAMQKIERLKLRTRKEALEVLEDYEPDVTFRQFLLTNLVPLTQNEPFAKFRVPLNTLKAAIPEIGSFPYVPGERQWDGPTLFIKGSQSAYINKHSLAPIESFFPKSRFETLNAGHWVHGDRPAEFKKLVEDFIGRQYQAINPRQR